MSLLDAANCYLAAGLCVLPAKRLEKRPAVGSWKRYQKRLPTDHEVSTWFAPGTESPDALCLLCGEVSGYLEMIDFDAGGELFSAWWDKLPEALRDKLVVEVTPSSGYHVTYRCESPICGNLKLAQRKVNGKLQTLIETRGEGGLFLCAPTPGYLLGHGSFEHLPVLTDEERDTLLQAASDLNEYIPPVVDGPARVGHVSRAVEAGTTDRPGDDFNARGDVRDVLAQHGWVCVHAGVNEYWRRPGKETGSWSATLKQLDGVPVFYVFSANAEPFESNRAYSPFAVYALLNHGGDFEQAARTLRLSGYGSDCLADNTKGTDISAICGLSDAAGACPSDIATITNAAANNGDSGPDIQKLKAMITQFTGLNKPIIHELLRECETMNVIASPKVGKSWFVSNLAICVASGLDWLGLTVEPGRVLHIDNELHENTIAYRYRLISEAMDFPHHLYSGNIDMVSLRGRLRDLYGLARLFEQIEPGQYKIVILDAFYRTLPRDTDENDNGAIANLYNLIDHYASRLQCAFVLIHHTSKGNQSGKAVTDVGAGAGSQSRAADTHLILRPHEDESIVVLESAVRSWPPMAPRALKWDWPLFTPTDDVDTSALLGAIKPDKPKAVGLEDFVDQCIATGDPCSKRSVIYEARQRLGLSERKAEEMLDLAIERGLASRIRAGSAMKYVVNRPGANGEKGLWTAALLAHDRAGDAQVIADEVGVSRQYVNQIRRSVFGNSLETGGN